MISALPEAIVVTRPLALTVAMAAFELAHEMLRPVITSPFTSYVVATSCAVCPAASARLDGEANTLATGLLSTRTPVFATLLSTRSKRSALPMARPVTVASDVMPATAGSVELHSTLCWLRST